MFEDDERVMKAVGTITDMLAVWPEMTWEDTQEIDACVNLLELSKGHDEWSEIEGSHCLEAEELREAWELALPIAADRLLPTSDQCATTFGVVQRLQGEVSRLREMLSRQVLHDALTALPNRALLIDRLRHALTRQERRMGYVAVLSIDLDGFAAVNQRLGHEMADLVLLTVARRLQDCVRTEDTVARFGGDEFVVVLEGIADAGDAVHIAERMMERMGLPILPGQHDLSISVSIGVALSGCVQDQPVDVLRNANKALVQAKGMGKARCAVYFTDSQDQILEGLCGSSIVGSHARDEEDSIAGERARRSAAEEPADMASRSLSKAAAAGWIAGRSHIVVRSQP